MPTIKRNTPPQAHYTWLKKCKKCHVDKPLAKFARHPTTKDRKQTWCMSCVGSNNRLNGYGLEQIAEKRLLILSAKDRPCMDCGVQYPPYVMDFDHRDKKEKKFNLAAGHTRAGIELLLAEIAKCDVVCANCHRIRTWKKSLELLEG